MDVIYCSGYYVALFLLPFIVYFLLFKKNAHSIYTGRDWFYLLKLHYATNAIERYKLKYREKNIKFQHTLDEELPTTQHSFSHYIYGCDDKSNSISLKFTQQHNRIAEFNLCLHLLDGNQYVLPGEGHIYKTKIPKRAWKINGLSVEVLEPYKRFRVVFNGLLRNLSVKEYEKVEHIQFNLIFNASGSPTFFPNGMDTSLLAKSLAKDTWRDGSWKNYLVDQFGYEQFGALQGVIKGDSYPDDYVVNFATVHSKYLGVDDRFLLTRALRIFVADDYGNLINVSIKSLQNGCSQFNFGSALLSNNQIVPVTGLDILLQNVGQHKTFPDIVIIHFQVETKLFKCVVHLNKAKTTVSINNEENGYENYNIPAECDVNTNQARGIVEFWYDKKGTVKFIENELLCEKNVDVFPNVLVSNIKNEDSKILGLTGGKGSSLALLSSLNSKDFTVPDGFIITVNAYENQVNSSYVLAKTLSELKDACCGKNTRKLENICKETVECFKKEKILPEIVEAIVNELNNVKINQDEYKFCGFAVRSSAIGEDSEELSAAGQNETFLGCLTTEQIIKSVAACWASQFTLQSVQYKRQHGLPVLSQMAVVVQKMVPADCAGVLFTCHPATSNPSQMVITSNYGLGETVVSGKTDPDTFILNRTVDCKISLSRCIAGVKNKVMVINGAGIQETDREPGEELSLTNEQALSLGKVGVVLEESFGGARDIEWAFCKDRLYLLQSRPVTTLNSWSEFELTHELDYPIVSNKVVLTIGNLAEVIPNSTTVLSSTSSVLLIDKAMQMQAQKHFDPYVSKSICTCQHRPMMEVIGSIHMNVQKEIKIGTKILDLAIFGHSVYDEKMHDMAVKRLGYTSAMDQVKEVLRITNLAWKNPKMSNKIKEDVSRFNIDVCSEDSLLEVYNKIDESFEDVTKVALYHCYTSSVAVFYQVLAMIVLSTGCEELTASHYTDFALILSSCDDVISAEIPMYLEKIAKIIRNEGYNEEFCTIKPELGVTWLKTKCPEAHKVFEEFLEKHGHRSLGEFEVSVKSWSENPAVLIPMIQANAKCEKSFQKSNLSISEVIKTLATPKNTLSRLVLRFIAGKIRSTVALRETSKSAYVMSMGKLKVAYRYLAKRMVVQGVLPSADLIYHLTHYEIGQAIQNRNPTLITKAMQRQRLYPKWCKLKFPEIMFGIPVPKKEEVTVVDSMLKKCSGTPVCTGSVKGRACVINNLDEIDQLQEGDILITYSTDIGWSPYFPMLSGIVTELGGLISHGAVVAREYGLPCIVGVKNATKFFQTGDVVVLSGNTGEIGKV